MNHLPAYKPRKPIRSSASFEENISAYGAAPKGYRWLQRGDGLQSGDIYCGSGAEWRPVTYFAAPICGIEYPIARLVGGTKIVAPLDKFFSRTVFLDRSRGPTRLKPALKALTDSEIDDGCYSAQTVLDLRDALREAVRLLEVKNS